MGKYIVVKKEINRETAFVRFDDSCIVVTENIDREAKVFENEVSAKALAYKLNNLKDSSEPSWAAVKIDN